MYFILPPYLASASALPGKTANREIASFHLNVACFFTKKHETQLKNITWSELKHTSLSERSTGHTRQDLGREHSILLSVTHMLCVSLSRRQSHSRCVKDGSRSLSSLEQNSMDSICKDLTNVRRYQTHHRWQFFVSGRQRTCALCV